MRVMMPGLADVLEFQQIDGAWMSESGATVQIAATMPAEISPAVEDARGVSRRRPGVATSQLGYARAN
jgi:hypothetical protein